MAKRKPKKRSTERSTLKRTRPLVSFDNIMGPDFVKVKIPISRRVDVNDLSKRTPKKKVIKTEKSKIRKKVVLPRYSKLSPFSCRKKRKERRRDYFGFKSTGRGPTKMVHKNRFTVRC